MGGLHCVFHFEALADVASGRVMPIELNCRLGGAETPSAVEAATGVCLPVIAADLALRRTHKVLRTSKTVVASANFYADRAGVVTACSGSEELFQDPSYVASAFWKEPGSAYSPTLGSASCLGWLCASGETATEAEENLRRLTTKCSLCVESSATADS